MENQNINFPNVPSKDNRNQKPLKAAIVILAFVSVIGITILGALKYKSEKVEPQPVSEKTAAEPPKITGEISDLRSRYSFPVFDYKKSSYSPSLPEYSINLSELKNLANFEKTPEFSPNLSPLALSDPIKEALEKDNFFITKNKDDFFTDDPEQDTSRVDDWTDLYSDIGGPGIDLRRPENSVFVTSDFALHLYHRLLDKEFKYIEQTEFYPRLKKITDTMLKAALDKYSASKPGPKKDSYARVAAYFALPDAILNSSYNFYKNEAVGDDSSDSKEAMMGNLSKLKVPQETMQAAQDELSLVIDASQLQKSPLFGQFQEEQGLSFQEDYTQYGPRSHYGENPILRTYWRAMMWYGRQNLLAKSPELTRDAMNIVFLMKENNLEKDWEDIYIPTSFFVGQSDDLGLYEYQKVINENSNLDPGNDLVAKLQEEIMNMSNPQIMSSVVVGNGVSDSSKEELQNKTKGFRFMGQRFTPDAFVFSTLTQGDELPDPKTGERLPSMPTALMAMSSTLENKTADKYLADWVSENAPDSKNVIADRMNSLHDYFQNLDSSQWTQNIYWSWLYTLRSLSQEQTDKTGYPNFMKNENWNNKNLECSLGSWTELKHDTLLYAKQSYAELGGGGDESEIPAVPKGYVEPTVEFWDRIIPLAKMTYDGLKERSLLAQEFDGRNQQLLDSFEFFRKLAISELNNEKISDADFERLRLEAGRQSSVIRPLPNEQGTEDLARSGLIADVHTDVPGGQILYESDGIPNYIYVAVKDANGTRLTKGLVYSQYEFKNPLEKRLTDKDWKERAYSRDDSKLPELPAWSQAILK